jgi:hypothetical protein
MKDGQYRRKTGQRHIQGEETILSPVITVDGNRVVVDQTKSKKYVIHQC